MLDSPKSQCSQSSQSSEEDSHEDRDSVSRTSSDNGEGEKHDNVIRSLIVKKKQLLNLLVRYETVKEFSTEVICKMERSKGSLSNADDVIAAMKKNKNMEK